MRTTRRPRLLLEALERREVPASIVYTGSLSISGQKAALLVSQNATTGYWNVMDGTSNDGTYNVTGNINITTTNNASSVAVQFASGKALPGNLTITGGNGV